MANVFGSNAADLLDENAGVTNGSDTINGLGGSDVIYGLGGNDTIFGGSGNDWIHAGSGADAINGGSGLDRAYYNDSSAGVIVSLITGEGSGGYAEGDTLAGVESLLGSAYADTLIGDDGTNELFGYSGNDTLKGGGGDDALRGEGGNDTLKGGGGADALWGDGGTDTVDYSQSPEAVLASLIINGAVGGDAEGDTFNSIENVTGSGYDDVLGGTEGANTLSGLNGNDALKGFGGNDSLLGGAGDDELIGEAGHDILNGGAGIDSMEGGLGNDTYYVDDADDELFEAGGEGLDTVLTSVDYALAEGADVETLATTNTNGTGDLILIGNASGNEIIGNNGDNLLKGGGGTDQLIGRDGNDIYYVDSGDDSVAESGGHGHDEVWTSASYTLTAGADVELLRTMSDAGMNALSLTGNATGNIVRGNNGNNVINGGDGNDELTGLGGADSFLFDTTLNVANNVDVVTDFNVAGDTILLDQDVFSSLGLGTIADGEFVTGTAAQDANDHIIYDDTTGALFYDSDGTGGTTAIQFAEVSTGLALAYLDFFVV